MDGALKLATSSGSLLPLSPLLLRIQHVSSLPSHLPQNRNIYTFLYCILAISANININSLETVFKYLFYFL